MKTSINTQRLFVASCVVLIATAMTFAIRANLLTDLGAQFSINAKNMGIVVGTAFWGFTLSMIFGGFLCDVLGMKKLLIIAFVGHLVGIVMTIFASGFWSLFFSTLCVGIANGMVEAACNPLIASMYKDHKTAKLNRFHVWFPGGIVIGGLVGFLCKDVLHISWQIQMATILIPVFMYGYLFWNEDFPETERVSSGVSFSEMLKACISPLFMIMVVCMLFTAATELGTNQWIAALLSNLGVSSILLLVFINGIMAIGRTFAGELVHKISAMGILIFSAVFSTLGLYLFSYTSGASVFIAAAIFAIGICFFWPTMLGYVSENLPKTGAMGLSIMGGAGMLSVSLILPFMGKLYDEKTADYLLNNQVLNALPSSEVLNAAKIWAGVETLQLVAVLPLVLTAIFTIIYFVKQKQKSQL